jgi:hypothetical protein
MPHGVNACSGFLSAEVIIWLGVTAAVNDAEIYVWN